MSTLTSRENTMGFGALLLLIGMFAGSLISVMVMLLISNDLSVSAPKAGGMYKPYVYPYHYPYFNRSKKKSEAGDVWAKRLPTRDELSHLFNQ
ncbi:MAG TPA: hypothetical protein VJA22_00680 [Patescibacteria group bacterium]|nr:hypothetical protein [Patescibacteria group bacterium]